MRIRSTKPEFWRSERIASVSWDARLVLKGLESYVDDNGVGKDDLALIVGDLFQRDLVREPSRTLARVSEALTELHQAGLLWRYDADGTALLFVAFWESVQRVDKPQAGRFPRPDGTRNYKDSEIRESVATPREPSRALAPGTGEQGNRGTGDSAPTERPARRAPLRPVEDQPTTAQALVAFYVDRHTQRPPQRVIGQTAQQVGALLAEGFDPDLVKRGLTELVRKGLNPSTLPSLVNQLGNADPRQAEVDAIRRHNDEQPWNPIALPDGAR